MMTLALITIPTVTVLIVITLVVIWLAKGWRRINPVPRLGCVMVVVFVPAATAYQAWHLLTQSGTVMTWVMWTLWGLQFLASVALIPLGVKALRTADGDGAGTQEEEGGPSRMSKEGPADKYARPCPGRNRSHPRR